MKLNGTEVELIEIEQRLVKNVGRYSTVIRVNKCITDKLIMKVEETGFSELEGKEVYLGNDTKCEYVLRDLIPLINWKFERK